MKRSTLILILVILISFLSGCNNKKEKAVFLYDREYVDEIKEVRRIMRYYLGGNMVPGASIAIAKEGQIIYSEGLGYASQELEAPANRETKFRIGEISEIFTSTIYLRMLEEGILHPDSSVQHYLPDFPNKEERITLKQLSYHTSGIRSEHNDEIDMKEINVSIMEGMKNVLDEPLESPAGWYQVSSMFNYNLLGAVMEKKTGKRFPLILKEYLTDTLNLINTEVDNPFKIIRGRTNFYDQTLVAQITNATTRDIRYKAPSRGLLSTAEDLVKLTNAVFYSDLLSEETKEKMFEPVVLMEEIPVNIFNGWIEGYNQEGKKFYGRNSTELGGSAAILIYPDEELVIACATNLKTGYGDTPVFKIADLFLPKEEKPEEGNENSGE